MSIKNDFNKLPLKPGFYQQWSKEALLYIQLYYPMVYSIVAPVVPPAVAKKKDDYLIDPILPFALPPEVIQGRIDLAARAVIPPFFEDVARKRIDDYLKEKSTMVKV